MSDDPRPSRQPVRRLPAPGAPPPGAPAVLWSARGHAAGAQARPLSRVEKLVGTGFLVLWRWVGLLALPWLLLHPRARRHIAGLAAPEPGWSWLHGASAGEHTAARALAAVMEPEVWRTSSSWRTPVRGAWPAPLDLPFVFSRWLDRARPTRLILVEAELWPGWLWHCRRRGIPVAVVNARPGQGTARWRRLGPLWRWLTEGVTFIDQAETGDLKLSTQLQAAAFDLGGDTSRDTFIAASTRRGDDRRVLAAWQRLPAPRPLLVLAPRHLDRVAQVASLLSTCTLPEGRALRWRQRSQGTDQLDQVDVLLLDSIGELSTLYQHARAAFIGGTFDPNIGGHSPAEPFAAGLPVVSGPHQHSNPVAWQNGIALTVRGSDDDAIVAQLSAAIASALRVGPQPAPDSEAAIRVVASLPVGQLPPERAIHPLLWPTVPLVHGLGRCRSAWWGHPVRVSVPVVSVGGLAAGGVGKTPAVAWLAAALQAQLGPQAVWVVARGYRRTQAGPAVRTALPGAAWEPGYLGDELELLRRRGVPVVSAPDRVAGAYAAIQQGARLILLDDGFQHRRLHRDLDIVCIDALRPDAGGPLPVGLRREPWTALGRAHWLWESHGVASPPRPGRKLRAPQPAVLPVPCELPRVRALATPAAWLHQGQRLPLDARSGAVDGAVDGAVHVAAGIAHPERFLCTLLRLGLDVEDSHLVGDHRTLGPLAPGTVVTEKDAARLPADADLNALILDLHVTGAQPLVEQILALVQPTALG